MPTNQHIRWPSKYNLLGVGVSATTYDEAVNILIDAAKSKLSAIIAHAPVHLLVLAIRNTDFGFKINKFDIVAPDGQPVRWSLRLLQHIKLPDRVYGPEMMLRLCQKAAGESVGIYLYGSEPAVIKKLNANLKSRFPALIIAGYEAPPFRPLIPEEDSQVVSRINSSGAGIVFLGLGCPNQEIFAYEHRNTIKALQICVGAAFDYYAGKKKMAPPWMQRSGLEWLFRLASEPRRLWRRYFYTNSIFLLFIQYLRQKRG
jgi:exopolysaccharide biosynthesis WecB/TagA/CpsF family protein